MHLLSLPDQALSLIFLALGSDCLTEGDMRASADARSMASCCTRLNSIYRSSVETISLEKSYPPFVCGRVLLRYPHITTLELYLWRVPGFEMSNYTARGGPMPCSEAPMAFPLCLITEKVNSLLLRTGAVSVHMLQATLEKCTQLQTLNLMCHVFHDRAREDNTDELCTFSLEGHASSLKCLVVIDSMAEHINSIDLRWLALSSLSALTDVRIYHVKWHSGAFRRLASAKCLEFLYLFDVGVCDEDLEAVLPFLPQLHSVSLVRCKNLSGRILASLPQDLELLSISETRILNYFADAAASTIFDGTRTLKKLVARRLEAPSFERFLDFFAGPSIESLDLYFCHFQTTNDLMYLLERTSSLEELTLRFASGIGDGGFENLITGSTSLVTMTTGLEHQGHGEFTKEPFSQQAPLLRCQPSPVS